MRVRKDLDPGTRTGILSWFLWQIRINLRTSFIGRARPVLSLLIFYLDLETLQVRPVSNFVSTLSVPREFKGSLNPSLSHMHPYFYLVQGNLHIRPVLYSSILVSSRGQLKPVPSYIRPYLYLAEGIFNPSRLIFFHTCIYTWRLYQSLSHIRPYLYLAEGSLSPSRLIFFHTCIYTQRLYPSPSHIRPDLYLAWESFNPSCLIFVWFYFC